MKISNFLILGLLITACGEDDSENGEISPNDPVEVGINEPSVEPQASTSPSSSPLASMSASPSPSYSPSPSPSPCKIIKKGKVVKC